MKQVARFKLTVDLEALLEEADEDKSGFIDYQVPLSLN
jgi:hypothetical protein